MSRAHPTSNNEATPMITCCERIQTSFGL
jgi:hypothetical protein